MENSSRTLFRNLLVSVIGLALIAGLGCTGVYYDAMERVGKHKRHILRDRVEAGREEQVEAQEQFQSAYERFVEASGYDGGELESVYNRLQGEFDRSEDKAEAVRDRIRSIEQVAGDLFGEWREEIDLIQSASLRRDSEASLRDTQRRYQQLIDAMKKAESKMAPVLTAFRDQVLYIKHNLNARAIASLSGSVREIEDDVSALLAEIRLSIQESERFIATLPD
jgi:DNA repair exonuclease SbcCD ATPase subunit